MSKEKNKKTETEKMGKRKVNLEELDSATGGTGLRSVRKVETTEISKDTISKI